MRRLILIIAIVFSGILMQAQMRNATSIHIHTRDTLKAVALEKFVDYLIENDILFFDTNYKKGIAKSEEFKTTGFGGWSTQSIIMLNAKKSSSLVSITITGYTLNSTMYGEMKVTMVNKGTGNVAGAMFKHVNTIVEKYQDAESITYSK